ncbi:MAG: DUF4923 family protein [Prevotella sp.]|uniref:DUF4923 family protein n=1 Tax=Prevotella sp. TaxID=59823 RepID=UPI002A301A85|nr:DUF4923 family protein [Prevotella sp.]MDD7318718.1 DUF4923 family protein [Prevotellaceae bacterium]MDY4019325.1 DUF4923 family protein [Prevotella sp.]
MKKNSVFLFSAAVLLSSCGEGLANLSNGTSNNSIIGSVINAATDAETITNIIYNVVGASKISEADLQGTWRYESPGCAFTSSQLLAQAGGEVAAKSIENELGKSYSSVGINSSNTFFSFKQDKSFSAKVAGIPVEGSYTYNPEDGSIVFKSLIFSTKGYVARNAKGISLVFESKKLLEVMRVVAMKSGNSTISSLGNLSENYSGVRLGFDLTK